MGLTRAKGREKNPRTIKMMRYFPFSHPVTSFLARSLSTFSDDRTVTVILLLSYTLSTSLTISERILLLLAESGQARLPDVSEKDKT
jgi:hypothetical protein